MKIIKVNGKRSVEIYDDLGISYLYPEGTTRIIQRYLLFNRVLDGEKRKGRQFIEQEATIESAVSSEGESIQYNKWYNSKFIDGSKLEKLAN